MPGMPTTGQHCTRFGAPVDSNGLVTFLGKLARDASFTNPHILGPHQKIVGILPSPPYKGSAGRRTTRSWPALRNMGAPLAELHDDEPSGPAVSGPPSRLSRLVIWITLRSREAAVASSRSLALDALTKSVNPVQKTGPERRHLFRNHANRGGVGVELQQIRPTNRGFLNALERSPLG